MNTLHEPSGPSRAGSLRVRLPVLVLALVFASAATSSSQSASKTQPPRELRPNWAFAIDPPDSDAGSGAASTAAQHVPNSAASFTIAQIADRFAAPDWHPADHPPMPGIVATGRKPEVYACGYCHLPNGMGRPENASLAGLPAAYMIQQVADFKSGARKGSDARHVPTAHMISVAGHAHDPEVKVAAEYFSRLTPKLWIRVVETESVPRSHVSGWMLVATAKAGREPIGERVIEMPENQEQTELRNEASGFVAYVPLGSIQKGHALVATGADGKTLPCGACHGQNLKGIGNVPSIAGRSPSYIVRQLCDFRNGSRAGAGGQLMKPVVANLTIADMVSIAAYTSSLRP